MTTIIPYLMQTAAALQLGIAGLNLFLVPLFGWREHLRQTPLLLREVFQVHAWFISVTLAIFATLTFRFAADMAGGGIPVCRWLAGAIGLFWGTRAVLQIVYYSSSHWRGHWPRTIAHVSLLLLYGGFAVLYLYATFKR